MRHHLLSAFALLLFVLCGMMGAAGHAGVPAENAQPAVAAATVPENDHLGFDLGFGYDSGYYFRGAYYGDDLTHTDLVYQRRLTETLSTKLEMNHIIVRSSVDGPFNEIDLRASLNYACTEALTLGVDYFHYMYQHADYPEEDELGLRASYAFKAFTVNLGAYHNMEADGHYLELSVSRALKITDWLSVEFGAAVGYNIHYYIQDRGWNHAKASVALPIEIGHGALLIPYIAGSVGLDAGRDAGTAPDDVFGGVTMVFKF